MQYYSSAKRSKGVAIIIKKSLEEKIKKHNYISNRIMIVYLKYLRKLLTLLCVSAPQGDRVEESEHFMWY